MSGHQVSVPDLRVVMGMALVNSSGFAHVRLTVTDIGRSKDFYDRVFGWPTAVDASASVDEPGVSDSSEQFYGGVIYQTPQGTLFGLRPVGNAPFEAEHTGLDHVSFAVTARTDLEAAAESLAAAASSTARSLTLTTLGSRSCPSRTPMTSTSSSAPPSGAEQRPQRLPPILSPTFSEGVLHVRRHHE